MADLNIMRLSELDRVHSPLLNDLMHVSRGDMDYHILYSDYVDNIFLNIGNEDAKWNASHLQGTPITISNVSNKDIVIYNTNTNTFENRNILYTDITYTGLGSINGSSYLKIVNGEMVNSRVRVQDIQPSGVASAGKYLRVSPDGNSLFEEEIILNIDLTTRVLENIHSSGTTIGRVANTTIERPLGGVGYAYIGKLEGGNAASVIFVDTVTSATKVKVHSGVNPNVNGFDNYYDIFNSKTHPLSSSITNNSITDIANAKAVSTLNDKVNSVVGSLSDTDSSLETHKSSNDHDGRYYNKAYMDINFARSDAVNDASILIAGKLHNDRLNTTIPSDTTGNAASATKLQTARNINNRAFNATGDIVIDPFYDRDDVSNATKYISFVDGSTPSYQRPKIDADLTYNPATNTIGSNAASANQLKTTRKIGGVDFNGTVNINLPGVNIAGNQSTTGNAKTSTGFSTTRTNYRGVTDSSVIGQIMWSSYGNGHTIFDASSGITPTGVACNNTNPSIGWSSTYPTLMGYNGSNTYGVRVDSAKNADYAASAGSIPWDSVSSKPAQATRWPTFAEVTDKPIVQTTGTSTTNFMSQKAVTEAIGASGGLGVGQTWQSVNGSRSLSTTYTNTTGRPILVHVQMEGTSTLEYAYLYVGGMIVSKIDPGDKRYHGMLTAIVPNGVSYRATSEGPTKHGWWELR